MKKYFLYAIAAMTLMACGTKTDNKQRTTDDFDEDFEEQEQEVVENSVEEASGRDSYKFETSFRKDEYGQCDALVLTCKSGDKSQKFVCPFNWSKSEEYLGEAGEIEEVDINFDGTPDVLVSLGEFGISPSAPLYFYAAFVWNEETQSFEHVGEFDDIPNIEINKDTETIESTSQGADGTIFYEQYGWRDGKLVMTNSRHEEGDEEDE